jgi:hypothetical protein
MVDVRIELGEDDDAEAVVTRLSAEGGAFAEEESLTAVVAGAIAVVGLAKALKGLWDDFRCGVIIDARGSSVIVRKDAALPRGSVVLINKAGEESRVDQPDAESLNDLIEAALAAGGGS